jgi:hypothetical protein
MGEAKQRRFARGVARGPKTARFVCVACQRDLPAAELGYTDRLNDGIIGTVVRFPHCRDCTATLEPYAMPPAVIEYLARKDAGGRFLALSDPEGDLLPSIRTGQWCEPQ